MFGHKISLNFDEKGDTHRTLCGGLCSILVFIYILLLAIFSAWRIGSDEHLTKHPHYIDFEEVGGIDMDGERGARVFFSIYDVSNDEYIDYFTNQDFYKQYFSMKFIQYNEKT